jgi:hypothetical protein
VVFFFFGNARAYPQPTFLNFHGDSFSTLYTTSVLSLKPYEIEVQSPQSSKELTMVANTTSIDVDKKEAFKLVFGENYALNGDPTPYKSTAGIYPISSIPGDVVSYANYFTNGSESTFKELIGKTSPNLSRNVTLSIEKSSDNISRMLSHVEQPHSKPRPASRIVHRRTQFC